MCSSLPLLSFFVESITQFFAADDAASQPHLTTNTSEETTMLNMKKEDVSISTANYVAAQKHFRQIQHTC